jgi:hypothetical protein
LTLFHVIPAKPESSVFRDLRIAWTPVFTGVTAEIQFFHTFGGGKGGGDAVRDSYATFRLIDTLEVSHAGE